MKAIPLLVGLFLLEVAPLFAQSDWIRGTVQIQEGERLPGVNILEPASGRGTVTQDDGSFELQVPWQADTLVVSYTGFATQKVPVWRERAMQITLQESTYGLDEVVVVGFGRREVRELTGAISKTGRASFEQVSVPNVQAALQGRLPGVSVTMASGGLDAAAAIRVRGAGSVTAGNQPLIVVDGIILSGQAGVESLGYLTNPFLALNPMDIESVEVLRDAAAASIYGARAANGVLLITTRSGRFHSEPRVQLGYYAGFTHISKRWDVLSGPGYAALWNEASLNVGETDNLYDVDAQPDADWQSQILQRGFVQEAYASVQGGSERTRYFMSGTFRDEDGYLRTTGLQRAAVRAGVEQKLGKAFTAGISLSPGRVVNLRTGSMFAGSPFAAAAWYAPNINPQEEQGLSFTPETLLFDQEVRTVTQQLLGRLFVTCRPLKGLELRTELGSEFQNVREESWNGPKTFFRFNSREEQGLSSLQWTAQATYRSGRDRPHQIEATAGLQYTDTRFSMSYVAGELFPNNSIQTVVGTAQVEEYFSVDRRHAFLGYFGRLQYSYRRKYLLALSGRYDGSSRFGAARQFGFFPAVSAGWVLSEEPFLRGRGLNLAKLRGSVGLTGNAGIGDFTSRGLVDLNQDYFGQVGYAIRTLENRALGWEKSLQWNAGLDLAFWDYRLRLSLDYYVRDTRDLLLEKPVPATSGVPVFLDNVGSIRNQGFEFELTADLLRGPFSWTVSLNGATLRSEVLRLADEDGDGQDEDIVLFSYNLFRVGESPGAFYLVPYAGVDPQTGDALYQNPDGSLTTDYAPSTQRRVAGRALPRFTGGMSHQFRYRGVDLLVFFHFKTGHSVYLEHSQLLENNMANGANQLRSQQDAWAPDHPDTDVPQARLGQNNGSNPSTRYLEPAGFLRLNNLSLGYTFSPFGKATTQLRVFAAAQNLFTISSFRGLDPDTEFNPVDAAAQGRQRYNLPAARTFTFGFNLSL